MTTSPLLHTNEKPHYIVGPQGKLQLAISSSSSATPMPIAILCHPHPLYGGTMNNKVITTIARAWREMGCNTVRFNYRGVGESEGNYSEGKGEAQDTLAVIKWAYQQWPHRALWLAGFSFGAYVSLLAAQKIPSLQALISIAPAVNHGAFANLHARCPWLVVAAAEDQIVPVVDIKQWVNQLHPAPEFVILPNASHFFDGQLLALRETIMQFCVC